MNTQKMETAKDCISSNPDYYNSDRILQKWGFAENHCFKCGVRNSELSGLLVRKKRMQTIEVKRLQMIH
jgi:hypothetical protein